MYYKIYATLFLLFFVGLIQGQTEESTPQEVSEIIQTNQAKLKSLRQLIVVYNEQVQDSKAVLIALERKHKKWAIKFGPITAYMGRNGFAMPETKCEGDGKTPSGIFRFGQLFCYESEVDTRLPYLQTTGEDKWIDDPQSDQYNRHVRGDTDAKSFEKLLIRSDAYKYCMVIEYNTHPVIKGKGSAIFFHLGEEPTSGCVTISEEQMKQILSWMTLKAKPAILMGTLGMLRKGL
jgi:L,D-peptidoglycan transpeptidase YkuD (ErfK/YbiS/YcfS/YnhG family)